MIEIGKYYTVITELGDRTAKALENITGGVYGIYSPSNYLTAKDNQGIIIPENSSEATEQEETNWNNWYNS